MRGMEIPEEQRWYLRERWDLLRAAQKKADEASYKWNVLNDKLNDYMDRKGEKDIVQRDKIKGQNLTLKGHLATWDFHRRDADRFATEILAFKAMKEMGAL